MSSEINKTGEKEMITFFDEVTSEDLDAVYQSINQEREQVKRKNDRLLKVIKKIHGAKWIAGFKRLCEECGVEGRMLITRKKPAAKHWQKENFGPIKEMWVQQFTGMLEDDFHGTIWVQIDRHRYLEMSFAT